jgi:hypothetical protein
MPARADVVLDFQDVLTTQGSDVPFFTPVSTHGFTLTATNPPTGLSPGFEVHGPSSIFYAGAAGMFAFSPASSPPDNLIKLVQNNGQTFSIVSIDLARNFAFDPAPTVSFTGTKGNGSTIMESFTVTTPAGIAAFQTFNFAGFTDIKTLTWGQPQLIDGLHQFSNLDLITSTNAVPEPRSLVVAVIGIIAVACYRRTRILY